MVILTCTHPDGRVNPAYTWHNEWAKGPEALGLLAAQEWAAHEEFAGPVTLSLFLEWQIDLTLTAAIEALT